MSKDKSNDYNFLELNSRIKETTKDGFFDLEKDKEAVESFQQYVDERTPKFGSIMERINHLVNHDFYYKELTEDYFPEAITALHEYVNSVSFGWKSFMGISKFFNSYGLKSNDKKQYLENYQERISIVALYLADGDIDEAFIFAEVMIEQLCQPATPTFQNAGKARRGEMISCALTEIDDSLNAITFNWAMTAQLSKLGFGMSNNVSKLRAKGETIKEIENAGSGVIPNMKIHEDISTYINQLGQREGSFADYINIAHADVMDFLDVKTISADEKTKMMRLSIGVIAPSIFFEKAFADEDWYLFYPLSVHNKYGVHMDDMDLDVMYDVLMADPDVRKEKCELSARELLNKIATLQIESGYPYLMYRSNANKNHPLKRLGTVKFSNLCTEIFQMSTVSVINDYGELDEIGYDIQCCLSSLNIDNCLEKPNGIERGTRVGTRMMTKVLDLTDIKNAPGIMRANRDLRAIGLGMMNYTGYIFKYGIPYGSAEALAIADLFGMTMNYYSISESMRISKARSPFVGFEKSDYADGTYFEYQGYLTEDYSAKYPETVEKHFGNQVVPTPEMWKQLMEDVMKYGMYHAYRMAGAPTQSISYIQEATSSVMPNSEIIETRKYGDSETYYPMPNLSRENYFLYAKTAFNTNQMDIIDTVAVWQKHFDQGISCILYVHDTIPTDELAHLLAYAHHVGLKSIYYVRAFNTTENMCETCAI